MTHLNIQQKLPVTKLYCNQSDIRTSINTFINTQLLQQINTNIYQTKTQLQSRNKIDYNNECFGLEKISSGSGIHHYYKKQNQVKLSFSLKNVKKSCNKQRQNSSSFIPTKKSDFDSIQNLKSSFINLKSSIIEDKTILKKRSQFCNLDQFAKKLSSENQLKQQNDELQFKSSQSQSYKNLLSLSPIYTIQQNEEIKKSNQYLINSDSSVDSEQKSLLESNYNQISLMFKKKSSLNQSFRTNKIKEQVQKPPKQFKIQDFVKGKFLGKGQFGEVYIVKHKLTGFVCAMKIISKKMLVQEKMINQITRQLKIQTVLNHPNVSNLYGFFFDTQNLYLLLELSSDGQLYNLLKKKRRFTELETAYVIRQVCEGLKYMHSKHILHRDIKPQNIILQNGIVKLCDFGWSVYCKKGNRRTYCGTPVYLSPQIVKGQSHDDKTDIWAIGVLTYELIVGNIPFKIWSEMELKKIVDEQVVFPSFIQISDNAKDFILKILKKNPQDRITILQLLLHPFLQKVEPMKCNNLI